MESISSYNIGVRSADNFAESIFEKTTSRSRRSLSRVSAMSPEEDRNRTKQTEQNGIEQGREEEDEKIRLDKKMREEKRRVESLQTNCTMQYTSDPRSVRKYSGYRVDTSHFFHFRGDNSLPAEEGARLTFLSRQPFPACSQ